MERPGKEEEGAMMNTSGNGGDMGKGVLTSVLTLHFLVPCILSKWLIASVKCLRRGSNSHLQFRKPSFYPLNYGDNFSRRNPNRRRPSAQYWKLAR